MSETKFVPKNGHYVETVDQQFLWEETLENGKAETHKPEELGLVREAKFKVLFMKEYPSQSEFDEIERVWYVQEISLTIRKETTMNVFYKLSEDKRYYIMDLAELGSRFLVPFESNNYQVCEKSKPKHISEEEATKLAKETRYIFGKTQGNNESLEYGVTV